MYICQQAIRRGVGTHLAPMTLADGRKFPNSLDLFRIQFKAI
jgi:hypothetical protein